MTLWCNSCWLLSLEYVLSHVVRSKYLPTYDYRKKDDKNIKEYARIPLHFSAIKIVILAVVGRAFFVTCCGSWNFLKEASICRGSASTSGRRPSPLWVIYIVIKLRKRDCWTATIWTELRKLILLYYVHLLTGLQPY